MTADTYNGPERRKAPHLSEEQLDELAERAANRAVEKMTAHVYQTVGQSVVKRFLTIIGALTIAFIIWAEKHNWLTGN